MKDKHTKRVQDYKEIYDLYADMMKIYSVNTVVGSSMMYIVHTCIHNMSKEDFMERVNYTWDLITEDEKRRKGELND